MVKAPGKFGQASFSAALDATQFREVTIMLKKTLATATIGATFALGMGFAPPAAATFTSCTATTPTAYNIADNVLPTTNCNILDPLNGAVNDSVTIPLTVNTEAFFGFTDWVFNGKYDNIGLTSGTDTSLIFDFTGGSQSGTFSKVGTWSADNVMFVFKDGGSTNLVGYLIDMIALAAAPYNNTGTYTSPFEEPPFVFPGNNTRDISHISVYTRGEGGPPPQEIPEPGALALLGLGLTGLWAIRRRRVA